MTNRAAVFPGSFDPPTLGHLDLIKRGAQLFDKLIVAVLHNPDKSPMFTVHERVELLQQEVGDIRGVQVQEYSGLLADFAREQGLRYILRGVRTETDCAYEIPMAQANRKLALPDELETVMLVSDPANTYMSSGLIRQIVTAAAATQADGFNNKKFNDKVLEQWVTPVVKRALINKVSKLSST